MRKSGVTFIMDNFMKSAVILGACLCCLTACKGSSGNNDTNANGSTAPTPSIQSTPEPSSNPDIGGDVDTSGGTQMKDGEIVLTKLNVKSPNNLDCNGYKEVKMGDGSPLYKEKAQVIESMGLIPYTDDNGNSLEIFSGHTVYLRPNPEYMEPAETPEPDDGTSEDVSVDDTNVISDDSTSSEESDGTILGVDEKDIVSESGHFDADGNFVVDRVSMTAYDDSNGYSVDDEYVKCIVSGEEVYELDKDSLAIDYPTDFSQLRKEGSCERLYIFNSQEEYDQAIKNREDGQAILKGEKTAPTKCVILNGSLVPGMHFSINSDGRLCVSVRALAEAYDSNTQYAEDAGLLYVPITYEHWEYVPSARALTKASEYFEIYGDRKTFKYTSRNTSDAWTDTMTLAQDNTFTMPIEDVSRIFGWEFWYNDNILKVVTDSLDDTNPDNFILQEVDTTVAEGEVEDLDTSDSTENTENTDSEVDNQ